ncbi:MFS transporter [Nocardiopsis suaedae]|uniref:MFS transporter n=1 Tax=Nocardiopsis suaedae TaxID=3018444 RepID=A0ABT4TEZ1_9ACTN|nr:MFS transporter [Nocardiopsis suaedae]MDA2803274.1 MFS transporter [Nocardiopsis suaedae]
MQTTSPTPHVLTSARKRVVLISVLLSTLAFPLTITGASLALPGIRTGLDASLVSTQWVVNAYNACFAAFLVLSGALADVLGKRRVFLGGAGLFCASGVLSALAPGILVLDASRALAGVGAAAALTGGSAILSEVFDGPARARAFGALGTVLGAGTAFGPTAAGLLVDLAGWRAVFAVPAAVAGAVVLLGPSFPPSPGAAGRKVDWAGAALFTTALLLLVTVLVEGPERGFGSPAVLGAAAAAAVAAAPLLDLPLLANRRFLAFALAAGAIMAVLVPLLVYLPTYLIAVAGLEPGRAGVWLLMLTVPTVALPAVGTALAKRLPAGVPVTGAVLLSGAGAALLTGMGPDSAPLALLAPFALVGAGAGLTNGLLDGLAVGSVARDRAGTAAGLFNTVRITSETVAIAAAGAVLAALTGGGLSGSGATGAMHTVALALGGAAAVAAVCVTVLLRPRR